MAAKKNQLVIDMGNFDLTDEQRKSLNTAIHNAVAKEIKAIGKKNKKVTAPAKVVVAGAAAKDVITATKTANLKVTFTSVAIDKSFLTATFGASVKTISQSDVITFTGLNRGDIIRIDGTSLGSTTITIDIDANPAQMNFTPGNFNDNFLIR